LLWLCTVLCCWPHSKIYLFCYLFGEMFYDSENMKQPHRYITDWIVDLVSRPSTNPSIQRPKSHYLHFPLLFIPHAKRLLHYNLEHGSQTQIVRSQRDILKVMAGHMSLQGTKRLITLFKLKHITKILHTFNNKILFSVYVVD
jgi:hypothetical protein